MWIQLLDKHNISWAQWSISTKDEKTSAFLPGTALAKLAAGEQQLNEQLTASGAWGKRALEQAVARRPAGETVAGRRLPWCKWGKDCRFLKDGRECRFYHPKRDKPCMWGRECWFLKDGDRCLFYHPDEDHKKD